MTDVLYPLAKQSFLSQDPSIDMDTGTVKLRLVNITTDYTYSAAHQYVSSVTAYSGSTDQTLSNKTVALGVFDDTVGATFTAVAVDGTKTVGAVVMYIDSGVEATSPVIAYWDSFAAILPNGTDIDLAVHASGFFAL